MGLNIRRFTSGIQLLPRSDGATAPTIQGELAVSSVDGHIYYNNGSGIVILDDTSSANTLTNKTIAVGSNFITSTANRAAQFNSSTGNLEASTVTNTELGFVSGVTSSIQAQLNTISGAAITALTGDVSATGPGSATATVNSVGGVSAANVASGANAANASTNLNTASTIVRRDASGNFTAGTITANLVGTSTNVTGIVLPANGGTGIANNNASTITVSGSFATTLTVTAPTSVTLPVTGTLATLAGVETFTNKTFGDAITGTQIATPSNPSAGFDKLYFKSDDNLYSLDSSGNEKLIGSGSGGSVNFIGLNTVWAPVNTNDRNAEASVGNWVAYANPAATTPTTMTGGSPTVTISRTTTAGQVIDGTASFEVVKPASNLQGEGVSVVFNVPIAYQAQNAVINIPYNIISGSISAGDLSVFIYDITNSTLITPINNSVTGTSGIVSAQFRMPAIAGTPANLQMRLGFFFGSTSATAVTFAFDDVSVSPIEVAPVITLPQIATPTPNPMTGTNDAYFKSDNNLYILDSLGRETLVGNTGGSGSNLFASNAVTTASTTITATSFTTFDNSPAFTFTPTISGNYKVYCGLPFTSGNTVDDATVRIFNTSANATLLYESQAVNYGLSSTVTATGFTQSIYALTAGISYVFDIQGKAFSAGAAVSARGDVATFRMFAELSSNGSFGPGLAGTEWKNDLTFTVSPSFGTITSSEILYRRIGDTMEIKGTFANVSGTTGSPGYIGLPAGYTIDANKTFVNPPGEAVGEFWIPQQVATVFQYGTGLYEMFYDGSDTSNIYLAASGGANTFNPKLNPNSIISPGQSAVFSFKVPILGWGVGSNNADPTVAACYYASASGTTSPTQTINYDTKVYDTANSVTASAPGTGSWFFTAPVAGIYHVSGFIAYLTQHYIDIYKNGVKFADIGSTDVNGFGVIAWDMQLVAGDTIDIRCDSSNTYEGGSITAQGAACKICINKVG